MFTRTNTEQAFRSLGNEPVESMPVRQSFEQLFRFYESDRPGDAVPAEDDGDLLLFQWGTYKWRGSPKFEINLTRQIVYPGEDDDQEIWQLGLTALLDATEETASLDKGNEWCFSTAETPQFKGRAFESAAFQFISTVPQPVVELVWERQ